MGSEESREKEGGGGRRRSKQEDSSKERKNGEGKNSKGISRRCDERRARLSGCKGKGGSKERGGSESNKGSQESRDGQGRKGITGKASKAERRRGRAANCREFENSCREVGASNQRRRQ